MIFEREYLINKINHSIRTTKDNYKKVSGKEMDILNKCALVLSREHSDLLNDYIKWDNDDMTVGTYIFKGKPIIKVTVFTSFSNNNLSPSISMEVFKRLKK